ncbi:hypothetical protein SCLCIDRAFT_1115537 [Scleroderma citrinum Foug A]|uniref:Uncharacterized protein n=1 Tax=Scleroderma citrinum Foug A TaxID=1036808 RepID=A0A0C3DP15_9AGAM|nr:hypothetical protein SCLCIDRAFT_1115537 [Scleroderma citrinum Foug A]
MISQAYQTPERVWEHGSPCITQRKGQAYPYHGMNASSYFSAQDDVLPRVPLRHVNIQ